MTSPDQPLRIVQNDLKITEFSVKEEQLKQLSAIKI